MSTINRLAVLGATGSIGASVLDVARLHPEQIKPVALAGWHNIERLIALAEEFSPDLLCAAEGEFLTLKARASSAGLNCDIKNGSAGLLEMSADSGIDTVVAGISGAVGLPSAFAAVQAGKRVLIANKEPLVMCGALLMAEARKSGAMLLPIDSEHNAIFQCLPKSLQNEVSGGGIENGGSYDRSGVTKVTLTASGGPFLRTSSQDLQAVTVEQALNHPNWKMGQKITVDSATLMNKGLELIEASVFFGIPESKIEVVIHPQSVVHSLVHYADGSVLAQLASPDMRVPLAHALGFPDRIPSGASALNLVNVERLDFEAPDTERFPCLGLAREAARIGMSVPAILNAANEVAVSAFLSGRLPFVGIQALVGDVMERCECHEVLSLSDAFHADQTGRALASEILEAKWSS